MDVSEDDVGGSMVDDPESSREDEVPKCTLELERHALVPWERRRRHEPLALDDLATGPIVRQLLVESLLMGGLGGKQLRPMHGSPWGTVTRGLADA